MPGLRKGTIARAVIKSPVHEMAGDCMTEGIRTTALSREEKTELEALLSKLKLLPLQGELVLHFRDQQISAIEPRPMLR